MKVFVCLPVIVACAVVSLSSLVTAQTQSTASPTPSGKLSADYPGNHPGIMIQNVNWVDIPSSMPSKTKSKHGIAASLSYGAVPATVIAEYEGLHASVQLAPGQPIICICHILSLPGDPVLVKLHSKKQSRELDGGKMTVFPIVGGHKVADANQSDLIPVDISQPESMVWLVQPQQPLPPGEYALMLGTRNVNIYPFTIGLAAGPTNK
jgi:hypothetical protein